MNDPFIPVNSMPCRVYITRRGAGKDAAYRIGYEVDTAPYAEPPAGTSEEQVVYRRPFADPLSALAHKLLLEQLSPASLRRLIRMQKHESQ